MNGHPPRLVLYGLGQYGQMMVRFAAKKGWPIVAAFNRAGPKVGQDIGRLAGLDRDYGIAVQDCDTANYANLGADVGIVTMYDYITDNFVAHRRLLTAGMNVICHGSESYYPQVANPDIARQIDAIAKARGVSFLGTGVWDMSRIWSLLLAAGACDEIHAIHNSSLTNLEPFGEAIMLKAGVGTTREEFAELISGPNSNVGGQWYRFITNLTLNGLGFSATETRHRQEGIFLDAPYYCAGLGRELPAGACAGLRAIVETDSLEGVTATASIETRLLLADGESEHMKWDIKGNILSPSIRVERDNGHMMQGLSLFNRVPDVIAAAPGLRLITDMPPAMRHSAVR